MSIAFRCLECAETYEVDNAMSGKAIRCRECHAWNRVPMAVGWQTSAPMVASVIAPKNIGPRFTFRHGLLAGLLIACLGSGLGLWLGFSRKNEPSQSPAIASTPKASPSAPLVRPSGPVSSINDDNLRRSQEQQQQAQARMLEQQRQTEAARIQEAERQRRVAADESERQEAIRRQQQQEAEKKEDDAKRERWLRSMSARELRQTEYILDKVSIELPRITYGDYLFMRKHWIVFHRHARSLFAIGKLSADMGASEFLLNLEAKEEKFPSVNQDEHLPGTDFFLRGYTLDLLDDVGHPMEFQR